tara:strand:+ start:10191 stop:10670 length:480 start_codon:yes stop_codon:yes gene_type:complete
MLICTPKSIFSWDFIIRESGDLSNKGFVEFNWMTEQGSIRFLDKSFSVDKRDWLSGHWSLVLDDQKIAQAEKVSAFSRSFELSTEEGALRLKASNPLQRRFEILSGDSCIGRIAPVGPFVRKAQIRCAETVSVETQLFCFWLAALMWKRSSQSSAGAGS